MNKKLKFQVDGLKDKNGNPAQIGDLLKVVLPSIGTYKLDEFGDFVDGVYAPQTEILARLHCIASQGLILIIEKILTPESELKDSELELVVGQRIKFKYVKWNWLVLPFGDMSDFYGAECHECGSGVTYFREEGGHCFDCGGFYEYPF
jgi:hypothetical protein